MKRYLPLLLILPLLAGLLCSCSADAEKEDRLPEVLATQSSAVLKEESANDAVLYYSDTITADTANAPSAASSRKLIKTVTMTVETEAFDAALSSLNDRIDADGGYVESLDISNQHSSGQRSASYTIRIPADQISAFTEHLSANTNVLSRNEQQQDITLQYVDTDSERSALRTEQERLLTLLESAKDLSEILEIEARLTEIRYRLESVESQLRTYDNQVSYATVYLSIYEVEAYTPTEEAGFWEKVGNGFTSSIEGVWSLLKNLFYLFIVVLPYLFVFALTAGVVLLIVFFILRRQRKKNSRPPKM